MPKIELIKNDLVSECNILLPSSKSIANRVLVIQKLCKEKFKIKNLSSARDTELLADALQHDGELIDIADAGTACRFMCAYLALQQKTHTLTGSSRMKQRPIKVLVDSLKALGAEINYLEQDGFLPLQFHPSKIRGGELTIDTSESSQFVSALLLIAPILEGGLKINFNRGVSHTYVLMTIEVMKHFGISFTIGENSISIIQQDYCAQNISIESDWSSASYFFSFAALIPNSRILLRNLTVYSLQGDMICSYIATKLGAETHLLSDDIAVRFEPCSETNFIFDFNDCPDLLMTFAVLCAIKNIRAQFTNIEHLAHKESNRLEALQTELAKINCQFKCIESTWHLIPSGFDATCTYQINTYKDHRIAMAFAPLALQCKSLIIDDDQVVNKSFPNFWNEVQKLGIRVEKIY